MQIFNIDYPDKCLLVRGACKLTGGVGKQMFCTVPDGNWDFSPAQVLCKLNIIHVNATIYNSSLRT